MAGETVITVIGNLTDNPELRFLPDGTSMAKFTIASTPRSFDRQSGEWKDGESLFLNCTIFRDMATNVAESLQRGARVIVQGRLRLSRWEDKESGEKRSAYGLDVDEIGPSLKFAQAAVKKMTRTRNDGFTPQAAPDDAWSIAAPSSGTAV